MIQSSFGVELLLEKLFLSNCLHVKERNERNDVRNTLDDVLESARASYKADPEKKRTAERERYQADPKRSAKRQRYWESPEPARLVKRVRYEKAKSTLQNQRGHRKSTTDKVIQRYVNVAIYSYIRY